MTTTTTWVERYHFQLGELNAKLKADDLPVHTLIGLDSSGYDRTLMQLPDAVIGANVTIVPNDHPELSEADELALLIDAQRLDDSLHLSKWDIGGVRGGQCVSYGVHPPSLVKVRTEVGPKTVAQSLRDMGVERFGRSFIVERADGVTVGHVERSRIKGQHETVTVRFAREGAPLPVSHTQTEAFNTLTIIGSCILDDGMTVERGGMPDGRTSLAFIAPDGAIVARKAVRELSLSNFRSAVKRTRKGLAQTTS